MKVVYILVIFLSAMLLFVVQPLFARMVLPLLGGSPTVWNVALVFYQTTLLLGYAYTHLLSQWLSVRRQALLHSIVLLLPLLLLPIGVPDGWIPPADTSPVPWLMLVLVVGVGLPFFVLSTTSPLLQRWFASSGHPQANDPYFLYAASNAGSMLALLSYPLLWEPYLVVHDQRTIWSWGYGGLVSLLGICIFALWRQPASVDWISVSDSFRGPSLTWWRRSRWVLLALAPSSLMVSVTTFLSTDIAAIPLLWIIPLALYLLTFINVFSPRPLIPHWLAARALPITLTPLLILLAAHTSQPIRVVIPLHLLAFFVVALVCHGELAHDRPLPTQLTEFYLWLSVGGALGGAFNAFVAPVIFTDVTEYPLMLILVCLLMPRLRTKPTDEEGAPFSWRKLSPRLLDIALPVFLGLAVMLLTHGIEWMEILSDRIAATLIFGIPAILVFSFSRRPLRYALGVTALLLSVTFASEHKFLPLYAERSFFGILRVSLNKEGDIHMLRHGSTLHGVQWTDAQRQRLPLTYYYTSGPIGQVFEKLVEPTKKRAIAVVGLGTGTLACYRQPGQEWTYYEIDPSVVRIARDPQLFTYLQECDPKANIILGDARLSLAKSTDHYDLIILDAYSSDAIPIHLITREALQLYQKRLASGGILAFHISNRHLQLEPVLAKLSNDLGMTALIFNDLSITPEDAEIGKVPSQWIIVAHHASDFGQLAADPHWKPTHMDPGQPLWTDDYSSLLSVFRLRNNPDGVGSVVPSTSNVQQN